MEVQDGCSFSHMHLPGEALKGAETLPGRGRVVLSGSSLYVVDWTQVSHVAQSCPVSSFFLRKGEERTLSASPVAGLELRAITVKKKNKRYYLAGAGVTSWVRRDKLRWGHSHV